jgi:hypothetical protein
MLLPLFKFVNLNVKTQIPHGFSGRVQICREISQAYTFNVTNYIFIKKSSSQLSNCTHLLQIFTYFIFRLFFRTKCGENSMETCQSNVSLSDHQRPARTRPTT